MKECEKVDAPVLTNRVGLTWAAETNKCSNVGTWGHGVLPTHETSPGNIGDAGPTHPGWMYSALMFHPIGVEDPPKNHQVLKEAFKIKVLQSSASSNALKTCSMRSTGKATNLQVIGLK